jgi:hypothetical protein
MQLQNIKAIMATTYVAAVSVAGLASGVTSASGWALVACFALLPAITLLSQWNHPAQTLSQAIQVARG